ncbi:MAG: HAD family hydrolase [Deltaproteobacteria bacterium]
MEATKTPQGQCLLSKIKAVIFDFDGTLAVLNIDFSFMKEQVFDVMKRFGVTEESIRETYLLEMINEVSQRLLEEKPAAAERFYEEAHRILHAIELRAAEEGRLMPGATATLERLRNRGMKIGIVTRNCEDAVRKVFPRIDHFCDVFVSRNSTKKVKPHPDHLTSVLKVLDVSGEEAVMVGDHTIDIQAGKRVGMMTIGVLTGRIERGEFERAGADYILREASGVCRLIEGVKGDPA